MSGSPSMQRRLPRCPAATLVLTIILGQAQASSATDPPPTEPAETHPADEIDALRGPSVTEDDKLSVVNRGMMAGTFKPLRQRPEIAIANRLGLDEAASQRIELIELARRIQVAGWFARRPTEMLRVQDLLDKGELRDARIGLSAVWEEFEPRRPRDPLFKAVSDTLPVDEQAAFRDALNEYWDAWLDDVMSHSPERAGDPQARKLRSNGLAVAAVEMEIRELTRLTLEPYRGILEHLARLERTDSAAHAKAAGMLTDHFRETKLDATPGRVRVIEREILEATPG